MQSYTVSKLSKASGVSIRTLHYYDKIGLLKPILKTEKKYRIYSQNELIRLQQILVYKEIGLTLNEIKDILAGQNKSVVDTLKAQRKDLIQKKERLEALIKTVEYTIKKIKSKKMITDKDLYNGLSKTEIKEVRQKVIKEYGETNLKLSEQSLKKYSKEEFAELQKQQKDIFKQLLNLIGKNPQSNDVQILIGKHYSNTRKFWGTYGIANTQKKQYKGLGKLYLNDSRFTKVNEKVHIGFKEFISEGIEYYAKNQL